MSKRNMILIGLGVTVILVYITIKVVKFSGHAQLHTENIIAMSDSESAKVKDKTIQEVKDNSANEPSPTISSTTNEEIVTALPEPELELPFDITLDQALVWYVYGEKTPELRDEISVELSRIPTQDVLAKLLSKLKSSSVEERSLALKFAMKIPINPLLPLYEEGLRNSEAYVRITAIRCIGAMGIGSSDIAEEIQNILRNDPDKKVRQEAAIFIQGHPELIDIDVADNLCQMMSNVDYENSGRIYAGWALCKTSVSSEEMIKRLEKLYHHGREQKGVDLALSLSAAGAIARRDNTNSSIKKDLLNNINNENEYVRSSSIIGLMNFAKDQDVREAVVQAVLNEYRRDSSIGKVFYAAGEFGQIAQNEKLEEACSFGLNTIQNDKLGSYLRFELATSLAKMGKIEGFQELIERMGDEETIPTMRVSALGVLRHISKQYFDYKPFGPLDQRGSSVERWQTFIKENYR